MVHVCVCVCICTYVYKYNIYSECDNTIDPFPIVTVIISVTIDRVKMCWKCIRILGQVSLC